MKLKKNLTVYVVRKSKSGIIGESAPCYDCYEKMKELGVKSLVYSTEDGGFEKIRFRDYTPKQKSLGRYFIETGYKQVHRNQVNKTIIDTSGNMVVDNYILGDDDDDSSSVISNSSGYSSSSYSSIKSAYSKKSKHKYKKKSRADSF